MCVCLCWGGSRARQREEEIERERQMKEQWEEKVNQIEQTNVHFLMSKLEWPRLTQKEVEQTNGRWF